MVAAKPPGACISLQELTRAVAHAATTAMRGEAAAEAWRAREHGLHNLDRTRAAQRVLWCRLTWTRVAIFAAVL